MTFVNDIQNETTGLFGRMQTAFVGWRADRNDRAERARVYRKTLNELRSLTNRDLADIGLAPANIESTAYEAAYGK